MSTRSSTHFMVGNKIRANVYRHADGYPEGHGVEIHQFFQEVEWQTSDPNYDAPTYLAAKMVVWLAAKMAPHSQASFDYNDRVKDAISEPLNFSSVGVQIEDPWDIQYVYEIHCDKFDKDKRPIVKCFSVPFGTPDIREEVQIPFGAKV